MARPTEEQVIFIEQISELLFFGGEINAETALNLLKTRKDLTELLKMYFSDKFTILQKCFFYSHDLSAPNFKALFVFLLQNGSDINASLTIISPREETMLTHLAKLREQERVKFLLDHGANINHKNKNGESALMIAVFNGNIKLSKLLLSKGADLMVKYNSNRDLLDMFVIYCGFNYPEKRISLQEEANRYNYRSLLLILHGTRQICNALAPLEKSATIEIKSSLRKSRIIRSVFESRDLLQYIKEFLHKPIIF
jgi:ankyrin repeat protein